MGNYWKFSIILFQQTPPEPSFWEANRDAIIVGIIMALFGILVSKPLEKARDKFGSWLSKKLESFGIGYRKRYLRHIVEEHRLLKLIGFGKRHGLERPQLENVYISLQLRSTASDKARRFGWRRLFDGNEKRVAVLGAPGSGKSTFLDYLALVFAGHAKRDAALLRKLDSPTPVYLRLREVGTGEKKPSLMDLVTNPLDNTPSGYFDRLLRGKCVVLLDGLDEVLDEKLHQRVAGEIETLVRDYPDNWYIVTCRVAGWSDQLAGFKVYSILPFGEDDIRQFAGAWYREVLRTQAINALGPKPGEQERRSKEQEALLDAGSRAESLWQALQANPSLLQIAETPLILSLIALVHLDRDNQLPKGRAKLYQKCMDILLEEWDIEDKHIEFGKEHPTAKEKLSALKIVAFEFLRENMLQVSKQRLERLVEEPVKKFRVAISPGRFIEMIYERSGILVEFSAGQYAFAHRALMDYLAALHVTEQGFDDMLLANVEEERWREVILIAAGLLTDARRATQLVEKLVERGTQDIDSRLMAWRCLIEDVQIEKETRESILAEARGFGGVVEYIPDWIEIISVLDPDYMADQLPLILGSASQVTSMGVALERALNQTSEPNKRKIVKALLPVASDKRNGLEIRTFAIHLIAMMQIKDQDAIWEFLKLASKDSEFEVRQAGRWAWCALGRFEELGMVRVPAGEFIMGSDRSYDDERPQHIVFLPDYYIAKKPVTVGEWRHFVTESGHKPFNKDSLRGIPDHPVVFVTWNEARKYAEYYGFTLPSEAEWEKAARGGITLRDERGEEIPNPFPDRSYPWGPEWRADHANTGEHHLSGLRSIFGRMRIGRRKSVLTTSVGQFSPQGDSPYGCEDMCGNVWEWTRSESRKYPYDPEDGREDLTASDEAARVLRGGSFDFNLDCARVSFRYGDSPDFGNGDLGFRVALPSRPQGA